MQKCCITLHAANCEFLLMHHTPSSLVPNENILQHCSLDPVAVKTCCEIHDCNWKLLVHCLVNYDMWLWLWKVELFSHQTQWELQRNYEWEVKRYAPPLVWLIHTAASVVNHNIQPYCPTTNGYTGYVLHILNISPPKTHATDKYWKASREMFLMYLMHRKMLRKLV